MLLSSACAISICAEFNAHFQQQYTSKWFYENQFLFAYCSAYKSYNKSTCKATTTPPIKLYSSPSYSTAIVCPFSEFQFSRGRIYRDRYLGVMVAGTWLGAFGALIATWRGTWGRFGLDRTIGSCSILPDMNSKCGAQPPATTRARVSIKIAFIVTTHRSPRRGELVYCARTIGARIIYVWQAIQS